MDVERVEWHTIWAIDAAKDHDDAPKRHRWSQHAALSREVGSVVQQTQSCFGDHRCCPFVPSVSTSLLLVKVHVITKTERERERKRQRDRDRDRDRVTETQR